MLPAFVRVRRFFPACTSFTGFVMTWFRPVTSGPRGQRPWGRSPQDAAWVLAAVVVLLAGRVGAQAPVAPSGPSPAAPSAEAQETPLPAAERIPRLSTSDGVPLAAWYYPAAKPDEAAEAAAPVVILLHDLGGSHETVASLARDLQARGIAVVAPDLRGHGASTMSDGRGDNGLKSGDFRHMTVAAGGRIREEAEGRGDVETVRNWIKRQADEGTLDLGRLVVVGSGVGAAVAAHWTVLDAKWPDLASGPQGGQVRGLVLVSPTWAARGFTISPALAVEPVRKTLPVLVIAGAQDGDALKIYEHLKRQRPDGWSEKRAGQAEPTQSPKLTKGGQPSLYLRQLDTDLSGDRLAALVPKNGRGGYPAASIAGFLDLVTTAEP
jgi:alpha-beta hydrolase superfamily lysophospholipase